MRWRVATFLVGAVVGFLLSQAIQSMIDAGAASKMKRSIGSAMTISAALERFRHDNGRYPSVLNGEQFARAIAPKYIRDVPTDVYGRAYVIAMRGTTPIVASVGRGGFVVQNEKLVECHPYTSQGCR